MDWLAQCQSNMTGEVSSHGAGGLVCQWVALKGWYECALPQVRIRPDMIVDVARM